MGHPGGFSLQLSLLTGTRIALRWGNGRGRPALGIPTKGSIAVYLKVNSGARAAMSTTTSTTTIECALRCCRNRMDKCEPLDAVVEKQSFPNPSETQVRTTSPVPNKTAHGAAHHGRFHNADPDRYLRDLGAVRSRSTPSSAPQSTWFFHFRKGINARWSGHPERSTSL